MDVRLGKAIRERRRALGLSQAAIADAMGISFQQVQKYERGANRVSFSALIKIAAILQFRAADLVSAVEDAPADQSRIPKYPTESARLVELFQRIKSPDVRDAMLKLAEAVAAMPAGGGPD